MTRPTSCSTNRMPSPAPASSISSFPKSAVSLSSSPDAGSSSNSTEGRAPRARPSSTNRAWPVGSAPTETSANSDSPSRSSITCTSASVGRSSPDARYWRAVEPLRSQVRRISIPARTLSATESEANTSRRWKVRPRPSRARLWVGIPLTSLPMSRTDPLVGVTTPQTALNRVVLPAPLGPISPTTLPWSTARETSLRAWCPPKRTVMELTSSALMTGHPPGARRASPMWAVT